MIQSIRVPRYKLMLAFGDFFAINFGFLFAVYVDVLDRWVGGKEYFIGSLVVFSLFSLIWGFILQALNLYKMHIVSSIVNQLVSLMKSTFYALVTFTFIAFIIRPPFLLDSRLMVLSVFSSSFFLLLVWRLGIWKSFLAHKLKRVAIIGMSEGALQIAQAAHSGSIRSLKVVGFVDDVRKVGTQITPAHSVIGSVSELESLAQRYEIESFILAPEAQTVPDVLSIAEKCTRIGKPVDIISDAYKVVIEKWNMEKYINIPVVTLVGAHNSIAMNMVKRMFDIFGSLGLIVFLSPVFLFLCAVIKLTSKGPVIYKQKRVGKNGKVFSFYKLRTMEDAGESEDIQARSEMYREFISGIREPAKIININRITRVGRFLRKTSLDELPQIWNVLKGDMSLVGPRPCLIYEYTHYEEWQKKRLTVKPGCTGLWQVSDRLSMSFNDMVLLDLYYMENMSIWFDLNILLRTVPVMLIGKGGK